MEPSFIGSFFKMLSHLIGIKVNRDERRIVASIEFRNTFVRELSGLYPTPTQWPEGNGVEHKLTNVYPILQSAVTTFRPFVPKRKQAQFDKAWL
jgi:hypothetical protein